MGFSLFTAKISAMKRIFIGIFLLAVVCMIGAAAFVYHTLRYTRGISVQVKESDDTYRFLASYDRYKTGRVHRFLRDELHNDLFRKERVDTWLTLEDNARLYIRTKPGKLLLQLNKHENDFDAYFHVKQISEGIKYRLTHD